MIINTQFDQLIFDAPWMIEPSAMDAIIARLRNMDKAALPPVFFSQADSQDQPPYEMRGDAAVISITGILAPYSYKQIIRAVQAADNDPAVEKKVLIFNTPGGTVAGAFEAAYFLSRSARIKPIYAYVDGQMTSAGQLLGSTAKQIAAPKTAQVGSIGVLWAHINEQKLNNDIGIEVTYLTAGKYKKFGNPDEPLSDEAKAYFQDRLDRTYSYFVDDVAVYRNMSTEAVLEAADGRIFLAEQGKEAGLVDIIVHDFEEFLATITKEETIMDLNELKTKHPELYAQVIDQGKKEGRQAALADAPDPKAAADEAATRMLSIVRVVAGDETADRIKQISDLGMTAEQLTAVKGLFAVQATDAGDGDKDGGGNEPGSPSRQQILDGLKASSRQPLNAGTGGNGGDGRDVDFMAEVSAYKKENPNATHFDAIQAVRRLHPQAYEKWMEAENRR